MVKKELNICDNCNKRTAQKKCLLCQSDLCAYCKKSSFDLIMRNQIKNEFFGEITLCKNCNSKLKIFQEGRLIEEQFAEEIINKIGNYLNKKLLVEKL